MVREMQRNRQLHYTPIGFVDDDPRKRGSRIVDVRVLGHDRRARAPAARQQARRGADRDPVGPGRRAPPDRRGVPRRRASPSRRCRALHELISGDLNLAGQIRPVQVEDVLGRAAGRGRPRRPSRRTSARRRCSSRAPAARSARSSAASSRGSASRASCSSTRASRRSSRSSASSSTSATSRPRSRCSPTRGDRAKMRQVFERYQPQVVFHAAAYKHVGMLEANPLQAVSNNVLAHARARRGRGRVGVERFVLISTDKAANPKNVMGQSKARVRVDRRVVRAAPRGRDALRRGALRQRARLVGLGDPDLPPADRARRPGHRHEPRDDALLHDDPRGGVARRPGRRDGRPRAGLRARHGRAGARSSTSPSR